MHKIITLVSIAVAAAGALGTLGATGASASRVDINARQPAGAAPARTPDALAIPGAQLWVARYNGPANSWDSARSVAVSPNGETAFVTGSSPGVTSDYDYATVAYSTTTGAQLWAKRYNSPGNGYEQARSMAVSPNGTTVFVTGASETADGQAYATVAYSAATGKQLWVTRYLGEGRNSSAASVAVSPNGEMVFVTGYSYGTTSDQDYATIAYNAGTGAQLWVQRYNGPRNLADTAEVVAVSPSGRTVFVTGYSWSATSLDYASVAYSAATGARLWVHRYGRPANGYGFAYSMAVSPDGRAVFVTGYSRRNGITSGYYDYATVAYDAATGAQLWAKRYDGPGDGDNLADSIVVGRSGKQVFVTGDGYRGTSGNDYVTVAYDAAAGAQLWVQRYNGPTNGDDNAMSLAVGPGDASVFVTGASYGTSSGSSYATVAYSAATGARLWVARYNGPVNSTNVPSSLAVSTNSPKVFVTGSGGPSPNDYTTIAYSR